jgi:hypothetical protein
MPVAASLCGAGCSGVWIENLEDDLILVIRDPAGGAYQTCLSPRRGGSISAAAFPDAVFRVDDFIG